MLAKGSGKAAQSETHVSTTVHVYTSEHQPAISSGYTYEILEDGFMMFNVDSM